MFLIAVGSLVTSTGSGDAVPDWWFLPFSYGSLLPPMVGGILYEHGHRLVASGVGLLTIGLAIWLWMSEPRRWVRGLGTLAVALVVVQGILGGLRVRQFYPLATAMVHGGLAHGFFSLTVAVALVTSPQWRGVSSPQGRPGNIRWVRLVPSAPSRVLSLVLVVVVFVQLLVGVTLRHTGSALGWHVVGAIAVAAAAALGTALLGSRDPLLRRTAMWTALVVVVQFSLGLAAYLFSEPGSVRGVDRESWRLAVRTGHVVCGALVLGAAVALALETFRREGVLSNEGAGEAMTRT